MPITWADTAQLRRKGNADYLPTSKGSRRVRTWQPTSGQWRLTALGRRFFTAADSEFVISLPVTWDIQRKDRTEMPSYPGWFPVSQLAPATRKLVDEAGGGENAPPPRQRDPDLLQNIRLTVLA